MWLSYHSFYSPEAPYSLIAFPALSTYPYPYP